MTDKQIIIDGVDVSECIFHSLTTMGYAGYNYCKCFECVCKCHNDCYYKQLKRKEQEREALQMSDNEAKEIVAELEAECEELRRSILKIFACLIKANKDKIIDTLWVDNVTTLWDYAALTLGIEGDQTQIEEQIIQKIREVLNDR